MKINEYFKSQRSEADIADGKRHFDQITCASGLKMSVQASYLHYCSPRVTHTGDYEEVEIGFPSARVEEFMPYIDGGDETDPTETVYGYVPVKIVDKVIADNGGIVLETDQ